MYLEYLEEGLCISWTKKTYLKSYLRYLRRSLEGPLSSWTPCEASQPDTQKRVALQVTLTEAVQLAEAIAGAEMKRPHTVPVRMSEETTDR